MITVFYQNDENLLVPTIEFFDSLPIHLKEKLEKIKHSNTLMQKQKMLQLLAIILKSNYLPLNLADMNYNEIGMPFFNSHLHVSNAYSEPIIATALSTNHLVGLDVEKIRPINFDDYSSYFTIHEWKWINQDVIRFYTLWTKKEALAKVLGIGMDLAFDAIELLDDLVLFEGRQFHFTTTIIADDFVFSVASNVRSEVWFRKMVV